PRTCAEATARARRSRRVPGGRGEELAVHQGAQADRRGSQGHRPRDDAVRDAALTARRPRRPPARFPADFSDGLNADRLTGRSDDYAPSFGGSITRRAGIRPTPGSDVTL